MRRVVKIGGSLLPRSRLIEEVETWLSSQSPAETLVIVGGGELIDAIRGLDQIRPLDAAAIHWRCVGLLQTTFQIVRDWFPAWDSIDTVSGFHAALQEGFSTDQPTLVDVCSFYDPNHDFGLPHDWRTTTDAIAAVLAIQCASDELVLLKSCDVPEALSIEELAAVGVVDGALPLIAGQVNTIRVERLETNCEG